MKSVSTHFSNGLLSLERFVKVDKTSDGISTTAAKRRMDNLIDLVNKAHNSFQNAQSKIEEANDKIDNDLQNIVIQEKITTDQLCQTQDDIAKLEARGRALQDECGELERQLSNEEESLERDRHLLQEREATLERTRVNGSIAIAFIALLTFGIGLVALPFLLMDIENAEKAVTEASGRLMGTRNRLLDKKSQLSNLENQKEKQRKKNEMKIRELEALKMCKKEIKDDQVCLGKINECIKRCMVLTSTTASRAKMMAIEANGELPDIQHMIFPLKAIAVDLSEASLENSILLSGDVDMKRIGRRIQMITSKVQLAIKQDGDVDW